ncbi:MAG: GNAT family N-acetyltransferase [Candidatus Heimdallarchaeota archaeon]
MSDLLRNPFVGKRLQFRHINPKDLELIRFWFNHPTVRGKIYLEDNINPWLGITEEQMKALYEKWGKKERETHVIIETNDDQTSIGLATWDIQWDPHSPSIDLFIAPDHLQKGYGSESLHLLLNYLFNHTPAHMTSVWISELATDRLAFFAKHGFQDQGKMRRVAAIEGRDIGVHILDLLKREWLAQREKSI